MLRARWYKVLNDLRGNKTRTALIVLSIAVGLFAIGMTASAQVILSEELAKGYAAINPSSGTIRTVETFDEDFVRSIRRMPGVADADGRTALIVRFQVKPGGTAPAQDARWRDLLLFAVPDYDAMRVNKIRPQSGAWPPPPHELLIERSALELVGAREGDWLVVETAGRKLREMRIAGVTHDLAQMPSSFDNTARGYIAFDTLDWLGEPRALNELHIVARNPGDKDEVQRVINQVKDRVEKTGHTIPMNTYAQPGEVPLNDILQAVLMLLGALGSLSLFLSAFLIVNTISALVAQQIRQIGIMKAVGARARQIVGMYLALVLTYGVMALLLAVPLGIAGAFGLSSLLAGMFNFDLTSFRVAPQAIALQVVIGLLAPVLSALYPVLGVLRITPAEAMSNYGMSKDRFGSGLLGRPLMSQAALRVLPRPLLLSLRNTFRRKGRLALTLATLTLGGAIFIGVFSIHSSLASTLGQIMQTYRSDVWVNFAYPQRIERVKQQALQVPGVVEAEGWARLPVRRVRPDGSESGTLLIMASPLESDLIHPTMLEGRWLLPADSHALVISTGVLNTEPDIKVGDSIVLKVAGRETTLRVVGVALGLGLASFMYADYGDIARITQDIGQVSSLMVVTDQHDPAGQAQAAAALESYFRQAGSRVNSIQLVAEENAGTEMGFNMLIILALVMAFLLAAVGGLGLMGTLSINVLERTREIGVMRAIGAADGAVAQVFIVEGIVIGVISWLLGTLVAIPMSRLLSSAVGMSFLQAPLSYTFSIDGVLIWLAVVVVLSGVASFLPARNASRLTVREVLAYE
jgi:putative ABC transport system permease protein